MGFSWKTPFRHIDKVARAALPGIGPRRPAEPEAEAPQWDEPPSQAPQWGGSLPGQPPSPAPPQMSQGGGDVRSLWDQYRGENPAFRPRQSVSGSLNPFID